MYVSMYEYIDRYTHTDIYIYSERENFPDVIIIDMSE